jgi:hypothetical protein
MLSVAPQRLNPTITRQLPNNAVTNEYARGFRSATYRELAGYRSLLCAGRKKHTSLVLLVYPSTANEMVVVEEDVCRTIKQQVPLL